jgi:hypothetical protein
MIAVHDMGLMCIQSGQPQRAANLFTKSAKMASGNSNWSMLSTSLRAQSQLAAEHGTAAQTADLLASALLAAAVSHDRNWSFRNALESYVRSLQLLMTRRTSTARELLNLVVSKLQTSKSASIVEFIQQHLETATGFFESQH